MDAGQLLTLRRAAVLGHPIGHTLSPVLHRAAYSELGLDWEYDAVDAREADLAGWTERLREEPGWRGLSLTMPLKRDVIPLLDAVSPLARAVGAVNTVSVHGELGQGPVRLRGDNTDVEGIVRALRAAGVGRPVTAVVLGAGATAASAIAALRDLGCPGVTLLARSTARAADALAAAHRLGIGLDLRPFDVDPGFVPDVVVSTLPAGAADAVDLAALIQDGPPGVLLDVVYQPWPTDLAGRWAGAGGVVVGGLEMLLHQAVGQVRVMTGASPSVAVLREAAQRELAARALALKTTPRAVDTPR